LTGNPNTPVMGEKLKKVRIGGEKNTPLINQSKDNIHI
jgi:hypothetical protein